MTTMLRLADLSLQYIVVLVAGLWHTAVNSIKFLARARVAEPG